MPQRMHMENTDVSWPVAKVVSVWTAIGITSWAEAASFAAFLYSLILIGEWVWKKAKARKCRREIK